jgi:hypothetical protein
MRATATSSTAWNHATGYKIGEEEIETAQAIACNRNLACFYPYELLSGVISPDYETS